ncbi:hypothetical protein BDF22DRAFT_615955 [Syncephalis plumigaleata]|nr:hypothetical protein BDF22DRAFT_615955 [Syncephalis plumigaleata]
MAFNFNWTEFDDHFHEEAKKMLTVALNKGNKPARIKDDIQVKELHMGTQPPDLEMLEIGELSAEKFRGIFKLTYTGDAYIVLQTKVQANPVNERRSELSIRAQSHIVAADTPLVVPMQLRISDLRLRGFIGLVVCKRNGVTLSFKNDPLEQVKVSSTFDGLTSVQRFLQDEIEKQLRSMFQEDLPTLVHNLSRRFLDDERLREKEKASAMRQTDPNCPTNLSVDTDKARSLPASRINTGVRPSFFSQPTSPIATEQQLVEQHQPLRVRARDAHSMPDRLPGQRRGRSAISSNSSSESSSSVSKVKERQHAMHQNRTVRFSEDLYMHQRSLSVDGTELERGKRNDMEVSHNEHTSSRQLLHQHHNRHHQGKRSVIAAASDGIYHSFAPLFREKACAN